MKVFASLVFFVVSTAAGFCRLGETEAGLIARYGEPVKVEDIDGQKDFYWEKGEFRIWADVIDGKCERIAYKRPNGGIDMEMAGMIMERNGGSLWGRIPERDMWVRDDGAQAELQNGNLYISSKAARVFAIARETARKKAAIEGL